MDRGDERQLLHESRSVCRYRMRACVCAVSVAHEIHARFWQQHHDMCVSCAEHAGSALRGEDGGGEIHPAAVPQPPQCAPISHTASLTCACLPFVGACPCVCMQISMHLGQLVRSPLSVRIASPGYVSTHVSWSWYRHVVVTSSFSLSVQCARANAAEACQCRPGMGPRA